MNAMAFKLLSGAQTGADRAALDWAIFRDIPHGDGCPKGRKAEDIEGRCNKNSLQLRVHYATEWLELMPTPNPSVQT